MSRGAGLAVVVRCALCVVCRCRVLSSCVVSCGRGRGRESFAIIVHHVMIMRRPSSPWIVCCHCVLSIAVVLCPPSAVICPPSPLCAIQHGLDLPQVLEPIILIIPVVLSVLVTGTLHSGSVATVHMQTHRQKHRWQRRG